MNKTVITVFAVLFSIIATAQTKVGTVDSDFILSQMPELTKVQEDLKTYNTKLEQDLKVKMDEYQAKVKAYQEGVAAMTDPMKKTKQEEIIALEGEITKFRQNATQLAQIEQNRLLQPLYKKIGEALEQVAKAESYTQVLTITNAGLAYVDPKFDLTETVMKKLGITLKPTATNN